MYHVFWSLLWNKEKIRTLALNLLSVLNYFDFLHNYSFFSHTKIHGSPPLKNEKVIWYSVSLQASIHNDT